MASGGDVVLLDPVRGVDLPRFAMQADKGEKPILVLLRLLFDPIDLFQKDRVGGDDANAGEVFAHIQQK